MLNLNEIGKNLFEISNVIPNVFPLQEHYKILFESQLFTQTYNQTEIMEHVDEYIIIDKSTCIFTTKRAWLQKDIKIDDMKLLINDFNSIWCIKDDKQVKLYLNFNKNIA